MVHQGKEQFHWKDVTADMMSDEERVGDIYVRHPPSYRSEKFHKFLMKLDEREDTKSNCRARFKRQEGFMVKKVAPINCKPWMVKKESVIERTPTSDALESSSVSLPSDDIGGGASSEAEFSSDSD